jgi:hypothetical protein
MIAELNRDLFESKMKRLLIAVILIELYFIFLSLNDYFSLQPQIEETQIYIGIFATFENFDRRGAQRETWLLSSRFKHKFLIDKWTPEWKEENKKYGDIISLNSSYTGYATGFGEKLYRWFEYAGKNFPKGSLVGKSDDDFYACSNLYDVVLENQHPRMYFGWWHFLQDKRELKNPSKKVRVDSQFVVIGWKLLKEVIEKPYCHPAVEREGCTLENPEVRYDTNSGGSSLGTWLGHIGNVHGVK